MAELFVANFSPDQRTVDPISDRTVRHVRVLVVEDNPGDLKLVRRMLDRKNFEVASASTLSSALEQLQSHFDIVLLDLDLPDCDGLDTLRRLRRYHQSIPVIVLTGRDDQAMAQEALAEHAAQDYLIKGNVDGALVSQAILRHLNARAYSR
jgi:CheY-like chemotaxis protein